jgi:plasmid stabilization system protein ParE
MTPVSFHQEAQEEMIGAAQWYERQQPGVGQEFLDEIDSAIERISDSPEAFGFFHGRIQYLRVHRFPYAILFYRNVDAILIIAVMHLHRKPGYWEERLPTDY